jgi:autotransporter-associated beta strand protein
MLYHPSTPDRFASKSPVMTPYFSLCLICASLFCAVQSPAAVLSWSGGSGTSGNWSDSANWGFAGTPASGDTLIFSASQPRLANTNNIVGLTLNQIRFVGAGGGYAIFGNSFTITNSIQATNTAGANAISNNITLAVQNISINVGSASTLTLFGALSGSFAPIKDGAGTLSFSGPGSNTYLGTTTVNGGVVELNKNASPPATAIPGDLVIGGGAIAATVRNILNIEIADSANLTIGANGLWDLNGNSEVVGPILDLSSGGSIQTGGGYLALTAPSTINVASGVCNINGGGTLDLGVGPCTITVNNGVTLNVRPSVVGSAAITKLGQGNLEFYGANTYSGLTTVSAGWFWARNSLALGSTNNGTVVSSGATLVVADWSAITNESLTLNGPGESGWAALDCEYAETNIWAGPITLTAATTMGVYNNVGHLRVIGGITGTGGIQELASGFVHFESTNANTYSGTTEVIGGTMILAKTGLGTGYAIPGALIIDAFRTVRCLNNWQIYSPTKPVTMGLNSLFDLAGFSEWIGPLNMTGAQITSGAGVLYLGDDVTVVSSTNAASFISGNLTLWSGTRSFINSGHYFSPDLTISANVSGNSNSGLTKEGAGEVSLSGNNTFPGQVIVNGGNLWAQTATALGNVTSNATVNSGGSIFLDGVNIGTKPLILNGTGYAFGALSSDGASSWAGDITLATDSVIATLDAGSTLTLSGAISGPGSLTKERPGSLTFSGLTANTYGGVTIVNAGTLLLNKSGFDAAVPHDLIIGDGAGGPNADVVRLLNFNQINNAANITINSSGLLDLNAYYEGIAGLNGNGNLALGSQFLDAGYNNGSGIFNGLISGVGQFHKLGGVGTYVLNGNNTYVGQTLAASGTLLVNGSQPQSPVTVNSGATFGGSGTVGNITASGVVSPGNGPGILTSSNVVFNASGSFNVELKGPVAGVDYDQLNVRGTNNLGNATLSLSVSFVNPVALSNQFVIINNDGGEPITGTFTGLPQGATITVGLYKFVISYVGGTGNDVVLTLIDIPLANGIASITAGNGNHLIDPDECNNLSLSITNKSAVAMTGVSAVLSSTTPGVVVTQPYSDYSDAAGFGRATNKTPFQISILPYFNCGDDVTLQLSINSSLGSLTVPFVLHSGVPSAVPLRYDVSTTTNIPDIGSVESTNVVSGFSGPLTKVVVSMWITHTFDADLSVSLIAPDGTSVDLSSGNGGGPNLGSGCSPDSSRTTFDDAAATAITAGSPPYVGSFRPEVSLANLLVSGANGNWRLRVTDANGGTLGTLRCWSLFLYPVACDAGSGACGYCLPPISGVITTNNPVQTGRLTRNGLSSSCGAPKPCPGLQDNVVRHYNIHTFTNNSGADECVSISMSDSCSSQAFAAAYLGSFDPANLCANYLGDGGFSGIATFSVTIPSGARYVVVVNEVTPNAACTAGYILQLSGLPCPPPSLSIQSITNSQARLYWPSTAGGYLLEATPSLVPSNWTTIANEPIVGGGSYNVTNSDVAPPIRFYRLRKP